MPGFMDALGEVGYALDTPGAYFRGALAGRPGERASGRDLLSTYGLTDESDPLGGLKGFGAEAVLDPLSLLGPAAGAFKGIQGLTRGSRALAGLGDAAPLARRLGELGAGVETPLDAIRHASRQASRPSPIDEAVKKFMGQEIGALRPGFAPFTPEAIASATGRQASHLGMDEASAAYKPWVDSLLPEEAASAQLFTNGPQARISHALRGASSTAGGHAVDPFSEPSFGKILEGTAPIKDPQDVMNEVVPYLDSALSRSAAPKDLMTYRLAGQLGDLKPQTAESLIGQTVSDPSYMSTTITPWGRFYGQSANPHDLLLDILVPKGHPGGYVDDLSRWDAEKELLMPRGAQFKVADAQNVPVQKIDYDWHRLDPAGKPVPRSSNYGGGLFRDVPEDELADFFRQGHYGDQVVPDEFMKPGWQAFRDRHLQGEGNQVNALLEMLGGGPAPHLPPVRRLTPEEALSRLLEGIVPRGRRGAQGLQVQLDALRKNVAGGGYPNSSILQMMMREGALPPGLLDELYRSFPR